MESNRHLPMDREPAEGARFEDGPPGRNGRREGIEPEEPRGRASRGASPNKGDAAGWAPPREDSPHQSRRRG